MAFDVFQRADILESDTLRAMLRTEKQPVSQNKSACEKQIHSFGYSKIIPQSEELLWAVSNIPRNPCSDIFLKEYLIWKYYMDSQRTQVRGGVGGDF